MARGDDLPPLHGLPIGIKDLQETAGLRTTYGSAIFRDHVPAADERLVAAVRAAGAIVVGKTNTPEFGAGANTRNAVYGATGNPFDPTRSAAGSSGGSAVALATGMVPLCTGSDTGGSLRNPAAFCGIVGFRPTPGLVANERRGLGWSNLSGRRTHGAHRAGPVPAALGHGQRRRARSAGDDGAWPRCGGRRTSRCRRASTCRGCAWRSRRISALRRPSGISPRCSPRRPALFRHVFARAEDATPDCAGADEAFEVLRSLGFLAGTRRRCAPGRRTSARTCAPTSRRGCATPRRTWRGRRRCRPRCTAAGRRSSSDWDVILTPSITISPRSWRELYPAEIDGRPTRTYFHWLALAYAVTLPGHPAVSLPVGLDRNGMPFGLQIVGPRGGDAFVLAVAAELEAMLAGDARTARPVPDIAQAASGAADQRDGGLPGVRLTTTGQRITAWRRCRSRASRRHPGAPRTIR